MRPLFFLIGLLFLGPSIASAQIPNGSMLWLRADMGVESDSTGVKIWKDQSGHHNDATQTDSTLRPFFRPNSLHGKPSVHFNGGSFLHAPAIFPCQKDYSVTVAFQLPTRSF